MKNKNIIIEDWAGNILYEGPYDHDDVDKVLQANRCEYCKGIQELEHTLTACDDCNDTGYSGDFHVYWEDQAIKENVYEWIYY